MMEPEATYDYVDEHGVLRYQEVRAPGKRFYLRRPDGQGGWINNLDGVPHVLYRLPEVRAARVLVWVEGPKDAETIHKRLSLVGTTCAGGVAGWRAEFAQEFQGKYLIVLHDNDEPGRRLRDQVVSDARSYVERVVGVDLPGVRDKGDITDWLDDGHTAEEFQALVVAAEAAETAPAATTETTPAATTETTKPARAPSGDTRQFPEKAWIGPFADYRRLVGKSSEASDALHWATLYVIVGLLIGRRRFICTPHPTYPNDFVTVIGRTGLGRKSTAIEFGQECLERLDRLGQLDDIKVLSGLSSAEGLYEVLAKDAGTRALLYEDELRTVFAAGARKGTRNLLPCLCRLYRCPKRDALVVRHGGLTAVEPFVSLLGATTTTWIRSGLEEEAITGGFFNRNLVISGERKPWLAHAEPPPPDEFDAFTTRWLQPLVESLRREPPRRVEEDRQAYERLEVWYPAWQDRRDKNYSETIQDLTVRTDVHVRKIALVYAVLQGHDTITLEDLEVAISIGEHCEALTVELLGDVDQPRLSHVQNRILKALKDRPAGAWDSRRRLQARIGGNYTRDEFLKALAVIVELGEVEEELRPGGPGPAGSRIRLVGGDE